MQLIKIFNKLIDIDFINLFYKPLINIDKITFC
jgi:hypothetical protein